MSCCIVSVCFCQGKKHRVSQLVQLKAHMEQVYSKHQRKWVILFPEGGFLRKRRANSQLWVTLLSTLCTNSAGPTVNCEWHNSLLYVQTVSGQQSTVSDTTLYPMYKQCRANSQLWVTLLSTLCTNSAGPTVNCEWHYSLPYVQTVQGQQSTVSDTTLYPMYKQCRANSQLWVTLLSTLCTNSVGPTVNCGWHYAEYEHVHNFRCISSLIVASFLCEFIPV